MTLMYLTLSMPYAIYHIPYTICHIPYTICHIPYAIYHMPYTTLTPHLHLTLTPYLPLGTIFESAGDLLTLRGEGFVPSFPNMLWCRFGGSVIVDAAYVSSSVVRCVAPIMRMEHMGSVEVEVTINGQDFVHAGVVIYTPLPSLLSISPSLGPWTGGSEVVVGVENLPTTHTLNRSILCTFGERSVPATYTLLPTTPTPTTPTTSATATAEGILSCRTPPYFENITHTVPFSLLLSGAAPITLKKLGLGFKYLRSPIVSSVSALGGPSSGNSHVDLYGSFEHSVGTLGCRFGGGGVVNASYVTATHIICTSPPYEGVSPMSVSPVSLYVTNNGHDFTNTGHLFHYYPSTTLLSVTPQAGPVSGNVAVRLRGSISHSSSSKCVFGTSQVEARYIAPGEVECTLPSVPSSSGRCM
jgi:hypothetical protein